MLLRRLCRAFTAHRRWERWFIKTTCKRYIKYPELSMSIKRSASYGDLVWLHLHVKHTPDAIGRAAVQIFRMKNGKVAEHWGVGQAVPKESKNNNTMF